MKGGFVLRFAVLVAVFVSSLGISFDAEPCSRVLFSANGNAVVVGRNMDWASPMPVNLYALPRGMKRDGMTGKNSLVWTAKYGTLVAEASDGMNEKGLSGHLLWLAESDYGKFDPKRPGLSVGLWLQYYLDNFETVREAVEFTKKASFQLVTGKFEGHRVAVHLVIEDGSGDSAIIEYLDGTPTVYHGKEYTVATNSPPYGKQLKNLERFQPFGGRLPLPGTKASKDRFVRAAHYVRNLPRPKDSRDSVAEVLSVLQNVAQPFGASDPAYPNVSATRWRTVCDLTNRVYYFESTTNPGLVRVDLKALDFSETAGVRKLDLSRYPAWAEDSSTRLEPSKPYVLPSPDLK